MAVHFAAGGFLVAVALLLLWNASVFSALLIAILSCVFLFYPRFDPRGISHAAGFFLLSLCKPASAFSKQTYGLMDFQCFHAKTSSSIFQVD